MQSVSSDHRLKQTAHPTPPLGGVEVDRYRYGRRSDAQRDESQHGSGGRVEAKGQEVVVTTKIDVDYDNRSPKTFFRDEDAK